VSVLVSKKKLVSVGPHRVQQFRTKRRSSIPLFVLLEGVQNKTRKWWDLLPKVEELRNDTYRTLLKSTANKVFTDVPNNAQIRIDVQNNAQDRLNDFNETLFEVGDKVFVTMASVYSHIRAITKKKEAKKLGIVFLPVVSRWKWT
jgi:hypothetical protein